MQAHTGKVEATPLGATVVIKQSEGSPCSMKANAVDIEDHPRAVETLPRAIKAHHENVKATPRAIMAYPAECSLVWKHER
jgi:hypothetical protein